MSGVDREAGGLYSERRWRRARGGKGRADAKAGAGRRVKGKRIKMQEGAEVGEAREQD
jgi:hypothetical protein